MTHKQQIVEYLKKQPDYVSARDLMKIFFYEMNPDTLTRRCRELRSEGVIEKSPGKNNSYRIAEGNLRLC